MLEDPVELKQHHHRSEMSQETGGNERPCTQYFCWPGAEACVDM
jgi:hypothetical protein